MAKANKFVHFNTRAAFDAHLTERGANPSAAEGNDLYYYTVYIKDTEEIYTHGKFYGDNAIYAQRADFATDLSGRVEATPEVFTFRPSAGEKSIKDDNAFIRRVKGNSIIMNQIVPDVMTIQYGTGSLADHTYTITPTGSYPGIKGAFNKLIPDGHKLFISMGLRIEGVTKPRIGINIQDGINTSLYYTQNDTGLTNFEQIITITGATNYNIVFFADASATLITIARPQIIDLTQMFGTGNEPTTAEEFRALYPNSYYPYNAGELRNLDCSGIKTVGFNQWDEQWEVGSLGTDEYGSPITFDGMIRSTNYNPIFPSTEYYIRTSNAATYIWYYDSDKKYIGRDINPNSRFFITPTNAAYFKLRIGDTTNTITTYNHDICINLHHTGYRDGEYEPYKEVTHALPLSQITNGEPLRKAGSVYDEINETEYIRRVGVVDLGSYDWYETPNGTFNTVVNIPDIIAVELESNYTCKKYIGVGKPSTIYAGTADNLTISTNAAGRIYIRDDAYKTGTAYAAVPALKASLSGVLLHYELAEPIVKPIETPIDFNYYVEDFGTEEAILAENSAPFNADIIYQFNAVDRIRQNDLNIDRLEKKVLTLPSEFKTINGNSIIGSGDLIITAGNVGTEDDNEGLDDVNTQTYLRYVEQSLTDEQKLQARINIGASSNIIIGNATQDTTSLQHNTLLKWTEDGTTDSMSLEFPTNDGSTVLNCGFLLYLTPDATSDYSLHLDGIEIYWANNTTPDLEPEYYYEMWFTSYNGGATWFGVFTKYTM